MKVHDNWKYQAPKQECIMKISYIVHEWHSDSRMYRSYEINQFITFNKTSLMN